MRNMLERHHIVFRSQGGLDFPLNYKYLTSEQHRGNDGPHMNRETDLKYKRELQENLFELLPNEYYTFTEVRKILGLKKSQEKHFKTVPKRAGYMAKEDIIRRLMGWRLY